MRLRPKKERDMAYSVMALTAMLGRLGIACLVDKHAPIRGKGITRQLNAYVGFTVSRAYQLTDKYLGKYDDIDDTDKQSVQN